jgi:hypothetical protein
MENESTTQLVNEDTVYVGYKRQQPLKLYKTMFSNRINIVCLIYDIRREILFKTACYEHQCTHWIFAYMEQPIHRRWRLFVC